MVNGQNNYSPQQPSLTQNSSKKMTQISFYSQNGLLYLWIAWNIRPERELSMLNWIVQMHFQLEKYYYHINNYETFHQLGLLMENSYIVSR